MKSIKKQNNFIYGSLKYKALKILKNKFQVIQIYIFQTNVYSIVMNIYIFLNEF